jgi:hypothetical protein
MENRERLLPSKKSEGAPQERCAQGKMIKILMLNEILIFQVKTQVLMS